MLAVASSTTSLRPRHVDARAASVNCFAIDVDLRAFMRQMRKKLEDGPANPQHLPTDTHDWIPLRGENIDSVYSASQAASLPLHGVLCLPDDKRQDQQCSRGVGPWKMKDRVHSDSRQRDP